ncbi:MAG: carboxymuconolactone decarboxylase family protein [Actinomycetes bacterium]|jgi:AhpD family alkylhydroperoxidase
MSDHHDAHGGMHEHGRDLLAGLAPHTRDLRDLIPGVYEGFGRMHAAAFADGEVDRKTKELIALAIAVAVRCDGCIAAHAKAAAREKATEKEVAETIGIAISMSGGPGTVYGPRAMAAYRSFTAPTEG